MESYRVKIKSIPTLKKEIDRLRALGKKIVFTNGCFDILHRGHTRYLAAAKDLGDFLIVAVNSDQSVRTLKGPERPVIPEDERAELLAALGFVDAVVVFNEETPLELIRYLLPDILVKGGDWSEEKIVGGDLVKAAGGEVRRIPFVEGHSTTDLLRRIRNT